MNNTRASPRPRRRLDARASAPDRTAAPHEERPPRRDVRARRVVTADPGVPSPPQGPRPTLRPLPHRFAQVGSPSPRETGEGSRVTSAGGPSLPHTHAPPPPSSRRPPPPSVVVGARPASVAPADCSLAPCPGRACLAISPAGTCWVPQQQQQQQQQQQPPTPPLPPPPTSKVGGGRLHAIYGAGVGSAYWCVSEPCICGTTYVC